MICDVLGLVLTPNNALQPPPLRGAAELGRYVPVTALIMKTRMWK